MRTNNHSNLVLLEELVHDIRAVTHDVVLFLRVACHVNLHAKYFVAGGRITPHDIHAHLLDCILNVSQRYPEWPLNLVDILEPDDRIADATMDAKNAILSLLIKNYCTKRHPFEQVVHLLEHGAWLLNVLIKALRTLLTETKVLIDIAVLMIATQQENLPRILQFQCKEQADYFEGLGTTVNVVTKENIIETANVTSLLRCAPDIKEPHQVGVVTVNISEDFDWRLEVLDEHGLRLENLGNLVDEL